VEEAAEEEEEEEEEENNVVDGEYEDEEKEDEKEERQKEMKKAMSHPTSLVVNRLCQFLLSYLSVYKHLCAIAFHLVGLLLLDCLSLLPLLLHIPVCAVGGSSVRQS
jgi:hypothetical protein